MDPKRLAEKKPELYKTAAFSFHPEQLAWIKETTDQLKRAGHPKPRLSLIVQEAVQRMQEDVAGKSSKELVADLLTRQIQRAQ